MDFFGRMLPVWITTGVIGFIIVATHVYCQQNGPPKVLPITTAESYPEGSRVNLVCSVSHGERNDLSFTWHKNSNILDYNHFANNDQRWIIDNLGEVSMLRIKSAEPNDTGNYTCTAKNAHGVDSSTAQLIINVEMKWTKEPKPSMVVGLNHEIALDCEASGYPQPSITWIKHNGKSVSKGNQQANNTSSKITTSLSQSTKLLIKHASHDDSGLYECIAHNGVDGDLRKYVDVKVRGYNKPIAGN